MGDVRVVCPGCGGVENISLEEAREYENRGDLIFIGERVAKSKKTCRNCAEIDARGEFRKRLPPVILTLKEFIEKEGL